MVAYKTKYMPSAILATKGTRIFPDTVIVASALESNYGQSKLSLNDHNFFGVKSSTGKAYKTKEDKGGKLVTVTAKFKHYNNALDSFKDYVRLLQTDRYKKAGVLTASTVPAQIAAIKKGGYATDGNYTKKLVALYSAYPKTITFAGVGTVAAISVGLYLANR